MNKSVPENEVKGRFFELLKLVEGGQEISVTRCGVSIARIVPASLCSGLDLEGDLKQISREGLA